MQGRATFFGSMAGAFGLLLVSSMPNVGTADQAEDRVEHPEGVSIAIPEGFDLRFSNGDLMFMEAGDIRSPRSITVRGTLVSTAEAAQWCAQKTCTRSGIDRFPRQYRVVREAEGGSGGAHYDLTVWLVSSQDGLRIDAIMQSEYGPRFGFVQDMIDSIE